MLSRVFLKLARHTAFLFFPSLAMAWYFLDAWIDPGDGEPTIIKIAFASMALEFVLLHSAAYFAGAASSRSRMIFWTAFYGAFVVPLAFHLEAVWPLVVFLAHAVSIYQGNARDILTPGPQGGSRLTVRWSVMLAAWVFAFVIGNVAPMPELGLTPDAFALLDTEELTVNDAALTPETARGMLAGAFLYYAVLGVFELVWGFLRWKRVIDLPPVDLNREAADLLRPR